jgi:hypothetical protein
MPDQTIYEIMCLFCRGELLALVTNAITATESFEIFCAPILEQFVPARELSQLRNETYEMVHSEGNSLAPYVHSKYLGCHIGASC